jgi:hypothetical protein
VLLSATLPARIVATYPFSVQQRADVMIYQAIEPPHGATCDGKLCASDAMVRLHVPRSRFEAVGAPETPETYDSCDLHWPAFRDVILRNGHTVRDVTGDPRHVAADYPGWNVFRSDMGRLYAARPGTTVHGWLVVQLRAAIKARNAELAEARARV